MKYGLNIKPLGALDLISLGALNTESIPGILPFNKATRMAGRSQRWRV